MAIHKPHFTYNSGATLALTLPANAWTPAVRSVGGTDVATSGLRESFTLRRDRLLNVQLRFTEAEWTAVQTWLEWAQDHPATAFDFRPDGAGTTAHSVYLDAPQIGEDTTPEPDAYPGALVLPVVLRRASGTWALPYYS